MVLSAGVERVRLAAALAVLGGASVGFLRHAGYLGGLKTAPAVVVAGAPWHVVPDTLHARETVSEVFARQGVNDVDWAALTRAVRAFDPARLRAGTIFQFTRSHGESVPRAVAVRVSWDTRLRLTRDAAGGVWTANVEAITWRAQPFVVEGTVQTSVSDAITDAIGDEVLPRAARVELVWSLAQVYDWVVDFSRDVRPGDRFRVLAERLISSEGEVSYGRILAARLDVGPHPLFAYRYDDEDGRDAFWDENGRSMKRELLRAPLEYRHISSGFSKRRFHPILRYYRPHLGIDFAAAYGAPVRAVGKGTVTFAGRMGGYGNMVEIQHSGRTSSRYGHLSEFGPGIHPGAPVVQGQLIGRVGASGLATSPHLHYELRINGRAVNPRRQFAVGEGQPIAARRRAGFEQEKRRLEALLESSAAGAVARVD